MSKMVRSMIVLITILLLSSMACQGLNPVEVPENPVDGSDSSNLEVTLASEATIDVPEPTATAEPTKAPTPTIPPGWFEGMGVMESDYMYYDSLLIKDSDALSSVTVAQDYGVSMVECPTCDLVAGKFINVAHNATSEQFMISDFLFRFLDQAGLDAALSEILDIFAQNGAAPTELPDEVDLPEGTLFFKNPIISAVIIPYGLFEIRIMQQDQNALSMDENAEVVLELAQLQFSKLQAAGY